MQKILFVVQNMCIIGADLRTAQFIVWKGRVTMSATKKKSDKPTVIKKYANRRLYDTGRSSYVTLDDLCIMVKEGHDFVVNDAKTGEDLTRQVLTQIIVEQESKGEGSLLPVNFLKQLIGFYGDNMQSLVPNYLEKSFEVFAQQQEQFRQQFGKPFEGMMNPMSAIEEMNRQNIAMFEQAMRAWTPFKGGKKPQGSDEE